MPTVTFNKRTVLELLGRKISDEQLADRISMLGTGFEGISGDEMTVEIFPNRPDLLSEQGLARALKTFMDIKRGFKIYDVKKSNVKVVIDKSVKQVRPYTACAIVKGLKLTDDKIKEIIQIQEKLHITYGRNRKKAAIGIYPLEHIRPPIYYKALHPEEIRFKPLDLNKDLTGSQILAIHPTGREYGHLLEGNEKYPVFIDSKMQFMSMPPIINSNNVGKITTTTKDVFIECSGFDFNYLHTCLNIIVTALADMGGEIYSVELVYPDKKYVTPILSGKEMKLDIAYVNKILGTQIKDTELKTLLEKMGHDYRNKKALTPGYRADILHPVDLVEDVAIAYGYENFPGKMSYVATTASEKHIEVFKNKLREMLVGAGLLEVKNYHLTSKDFQTRLMNFNADLVELGNSVNSEYNVLRYWLIPCLMETLKYNKHYEYPQNIFEIGTIFRINEDFETRTAESERLAIAYCGSDANFTKIKQLLDIIMDALGMKYEILDTEHSSFIKGRVGRVTVNNEKIAYVGELHPQVLLNWQLEMPVSVLEINVTELFRTMHFPEAEIEKHPQQEKKQEKKQENRFEKKHEKKQEIRQKHEKKQGKKAKNMLKAKHISKKKKIKSR